MSDTAYGELQYGPGRVTGAKEKGPMPCQCGHPADEHLFPGGPIPATLTRDTLWRACTVCECGGYAP